MKLLKKLTKKQKEEKKARKKAKRMLRVCGYCATFCAGAACMGYLVYQHRDVIAAHAGNGKKGRGRHKCCLLKHCGKK